MTRIALAPLLAVTGCNWVFGLEPTVAGDAAPTELPPGPRTKLVWAIATTDGMPAPPALDPVIEYRPIGSETLYPAPPIIQVGDDNALREATYDLADGSFEIPYELRESAHRIVYLLPGESVPHEVQWALTGATLVVPRTTRADAPKPPAGSGYTIMPAGLTGTLSAPAAYTNGVFSYCDDFTAFDVSSGTITYRYAANAKPLAGPSGAPQQAKGDWVLVGEFVARTNELQSLDGWAVARGELVANMMTTATSGGWVTTERTLSALSCPGANCLPGGNAGDTVQRIEDVLGGLGGTETYRFAYGASPSTELAAFVPGKAPTYLPEPLILPFAMSTLIESTVPVADPTAALGLEPVLFVRVASTRVVNGVALTSAIQTVTNVFQGTIQYPAPLALNIKLGTISLSAEQPEGVAIPASSGPVRLEFEQEAGFTADDFVITLYEITGTSLAPVRHYHVIEPNAKIDGNLLVPAHTYVLGITARSGYGAADRGDYQKAQYPFGSTTTFTRTFVVQ